MPKEKLRRKEERSPFLEGVSRQLPDARQDFGNRRSVRLSLSLPELFRSADDASSRRPGDQRGILLNRETVTATLPDRQDA